MVVLDANVVIAFQVNGHVHQQRAAEILDTDDDLVLHPLTLAECATGVSRIGRMAEFRRWIMRVGIDTWRPDDDHWYRIATLRAGSPLTLPDCCALDCARTLSATLATFDYQLARVSRSFGVNVDDGGGDT